MSPVNQSLDKMNKTPYKPLRILSLSGGGCRSISLLYILKNVMEGISRENGTPDGELKPCDYFDLIGGTSGGGVVAIMLAKLRMSVSDCITEFERLAQQTFKNGRKRGPRLHRFSPSCLVNGVKEVLRKQGRPEDEVLLDPSEDNGCRTFVTTLLNGCLTENSDPILFRSYPAPYSQDGPGSGCTIWEAIRATTAAPLIFKPIKIGDYEFVDAAVGNFNDPADVTEKEAKKIWPNRGIEVFLSLGTGERTPLGLPSRNPFQYGRNLIRILRNNVTGSGQMITHLQQTYSPDVFWRFNVDGGLGDIKITDWKKSSELKSLTEAYLKREETVSLVEALAAKVVNDDATWGPSLEGEFMPSVLASDMKYPYAERWLKTAFEQIQCGFESYSKAKEFFKERQLQKEENRNTEARKSEIKYKMYSRRARTCITRAIISLANEYEATHKPQPYFEAKALKCRLTEIEADFPTPQLLTNLKREIRPPQLANPNPETVRSNDITELNKDWRRRNIAAQVKDGE